MGDADSMPRRRRYRSLQGATVRCKMLQDAAERCALRLDATGSRCAKEPMPLVVEIPPAVLGVACASQHPSLGMLWSVS